MDHDQVVPHLDLEEIRRIADNVDLKYKQIKIAGCICCLVIIIIVVVFVVTGTGFTGGDASMSYTYNYLKSVDYFYDGSASHWNS